LIFRPFRNTARILANDIARQVNEIEHRPGAAFGDIHHLVSGARGRSALETGAVQDGLVWAGQVVGLIDDVPTVDALIQRIVAECRERLAAAARFVNG